MYLTYSYLAFRKLRPCSRNTSVRHMQRSLDPLPKNNRQSWTHKEKFFSHYYYLCRRSNTLYLWYWRLVLTVTLCTAAKAGRRHKNPICYRSWTLTDHEKNLNMTRREFLAGVWVASLLCTYLETRIFIFRTDYQKLRLLLIFANETGKLVS